MMKAKTHTMNNRFQMTNLPISDDKIESKKTRDRYSYKFT